MASVNEHEFVSHMAMIFIVVSELIANTHDGICADENQDRIIWAGSRALSNMWHAYEQIYR